MQRFNLGYFQFKTINYISATRIIRYNFKYILENYKYILENLNKDILLVKKQLINMK